MSRREYFFVEPDQVIWQSGVATELYIRGEEHHHLTRVLRHQPGDRIFAVDGRGMFYAGTIETITKAFSRVRIEKVEPRHGEPRFQLTLAVGLPRLSRFEWLLEKVVEIGVVGVVPIISRYTVVKPETKKMSRWRNIARAAMKQCGRSVLPEIQPPMPLEALWRQVEQFDVRIIAHAPLPPQARPFGAGEQSAPQGTSGLLLVGPEGGFAPEEVQKAIDGGFQFLSLGGRRLRTETAGVVASALILHVLDEIQ